MSADRSPTEGAPRLSTEWAFAGQPAVVLENRHLRGVLLPGLGSKLISLVDKRADAELLWRNDRVPVRPVPFGAAYDDAFLGGWDELFPNDEAEELAGEPMPDHGELWSSPWTVTASGADGEQAWVELELRPPVSATRLRKRLVLGRGADLRVDYEVTNQGRRDLPYLWKGHVAVAVEPGTRVSMAAGEVLVHAFGAPRVRPGGGSFRWPVATESGSTYDFRELPDTADRGVSELLMATELSEGRCGVEHPSGAGLSLEWDRAALPSCWLFGSYGGGWRGLDVLVLEPCTGYGMSVNDGVGAGTHQILPAGGTRRWALTARVGAGEDRVAADS